MGFLDARDEVALADVGGANNTRIQRNPHGLGRSDAPTAGTNEQAASGDGGAIARSMCRAFWRSAEEQRE
jgi:hypothetical protein